MHVNMVQRKSELIQIKRGNSYEKGGGGCVCGERVSETERDRDCFRGPEPAGIQVRRKSNLLGPGKNLLS